MGIVNPSMLEIYDDIPKELLDYVEDVILNRRDDATERLLDYAESLSGDVKKSSSMIEEWREETLQKRITHSLVKGIDKYAELDAEEARLKEDKAIKRICGYIGVSPADFHSIRAMYVQETTGTYTILEVDPSATNDQVKRAYRKMAAKFHPDKVAHLGDEFGKLAEEKFKAVNDAYEKIKKERGIK